MAIATTLYNDPACPWGYSASPAFSVLRWRYRDQLDWRLVVIVLREGPIGAPADGYNPARQARGARMFRERYGMPVGAQARSRLIATDRVCRALVATRLAHPGREIAAMRALQFAWFNTTDLLDEDAAIERAIARVDGIDASAVIAALDSPEVAGAYEADKAEARTAAGGPTEFQGKAAVDGELVRYTAPSLIFELEGRRLEGGGFQPVEAYDVLVANLDPTLERTPPPDGPLPLLEYFSDGLATQEVAALLAGNLVVPDRGAAEEALIELAADGAITREALGNDALWRLAA
ncbi:MAG TPA: DsbA family protein [Solirubrobacteraceae bacterium]|nr:DsbA family protein [Solirubrobacteraceae bacterium]